jgi:hypothetical protein
MSGKVTSFFPRGAVPDQNDMAVCEIAIQSLTPASITSAWPVAHVESFCGRLSLHWGTEV